MTDLVDASRRATPATTTWNAQQVGAVLAAAEGTNLAGLWRLAPLTGMRRGEILGPKWEEVDLERGELPIRRTLSRGKGGSWEIRTPKTAAGRRSIALPSSAVEALKRHRVREVERRLELGPVWSDSGFVFTNGTGGPFAVNVLDAQFRRLIATAGVPKIRFHDLRHTCATLMLANGEHPKVVAERLGHSDGGITLNRYSHVSSGMQRGAASRADAQKSSQWFVTKV